VIPVARVLSGRCLVVGHDVGTAKAKEIRPVSRACTKLDQRRISHDGIQEMGGWIDIGVSLGKLQTISNRIRKL
jgi:hypothetical protein